MALMIEEWVFNAAMSWIPEPEPISTQYPFTPDISETRPSNSYESAPMYTRW